MMLASIYLPNCDVCVVNCLSTGMPVGAGRAAAVAAVVGPSQLPTRSSTLCSGQAALGVP